MELLSFELVAVELIDKTDILDLTHPILDNQWVCEPKIQIGHNPKGQVGLNVDVEVVRLKKDKKVGIQTRTSFILNLKTKDINPTQKNLEFLTTCTQIAYAHSRVMFIQEMKGTFFEGDILNVESTYSVAKKLMLSLNISRN